MSNQNHVEQEIEKILQGFESPERLEPGPYFRTRLQARINEEEARNSGAAGMFSKAIPQLLILLIIALNAYTGIALFNPDSLEESTSVSELEAFGEIYGLKASRKTFIALEED